MGIKPEYIVKIDDGYYLGSSSWKPVERERAERMSHKEARVIQGKLKRLGYASSMELYSK